MAHRPKLVCAGTAVALFGWACAAFAGCAHGSGQRSLGLLPGVLPGVINDPGNRSLRRAILSYGLAQTCAELTHRGAALRLRDDDPVMGRFFARTCNYQELESGDAFVQFAGVGYAWTNVSLRVGFEAGGAIHYDQDFLMDGSTMYAYFRTKTIASNTFDTRMVERAGTQGGAFAGAFANPIAKQLVEQQLARGFTVIRDSNGAVEFGAGVIEKGQRPPKPFTVRGQDRITLVNERTEVHGQQLDFVGPVRVASSGEALYLHMTIDGIPAVDVMVVSKDVGDAWLEKTIREPGVAQPPAPVLTSDLVQIRTPWQKTVPLAEGYYYVVLDNSSVVGAVAPPSTGGSLLPGPLAPSDPAALVSIAVQVGDAP